MFSLFQSKSYFVISGAFLSVFNVETEKMSIINHDACVQTLEEVIASQLFHVYVGFGISPGLIASCNYEMILYLNDTCLLFPAG